MAEVKIRIDTIPPLGPLVNAVIAVTRQWTDMARSYGDTDENLALAELLDTLTDAARDLREKR